MPAGSRTFVLLPVQSRTAVRQLRVASADRPRLPHRAATELWYSGEQKGVCHAWLAPTTAASGPTQNKAVAISYHGHIAGMGQLPQECRSVAGPLMPGIFMSARQPCRSARRRLPLLSSSACPAQPAPDEQRFWPASRMWRSFPASNAARCGVVRPPSAHARLSRARRCVGCRWRNAACDCSGSVSAQFAAYGRGCFVDALISPPISSTRRCRSPAPGRCRKRRVIG